MPASNLKLFFVFISLILLQITVLDGVNFLGYIDPYLYIAFIFIFPIKRDKFSILSLSFLLGLSIDAFMDSGGIHAIACVTISYVRFYLFKKVFQKSENEYELFNFKEETFGDIFKYISILTLIHHFILFSLINFSTSHFLRNVAYNTLITSFLTLLLYFIGSFILGKQNSNET